MTQPATRRTILSTGAAALAVGCVGCGGNDSASSSSASSSPSGTPSNVAASEDVAAATGQALARTAEIPEGGGKIFKERKIVVTQPAKGEFKAFSAICTHQGCTVAKVADGTIDCPCHGSRFHIADGTVAHGPATRALPAEQIKVEGNSIHLT
ncbi:Rieske (2Fe-2S) protein [Streptomyces sp. NBC_00820]|uniref:Rieske (2Fe-2S) protein n=1 Tax=Streptomyces sp. NBC_00820 TaxID=2975842 RepID=UPI002ED319D1|nr:Rieske (2Fe-2S) protein [Streptomyces sp. NBC_00820]